MNKKNYEPTPIYNRKALREVIRNRAISVNGYHNVSAYTSKAFKEIREKMLDKENK